MENIVISKEVMEDLIRLKEELDSVVESIELMVDEKFMKSYKDAKEQIRKREFDSWDEL